MEKSMSESRIQQECVIWFRNKCVVEDLPFLILSIPNDNQAKFKATGLLKGASDLIVVGLKVVYWIELKTPIGRQSPEQKEFERKINNLKFDYVLIRSVEEFQEFCNKTIFDEVQNTY